MLDPLGPGKIGDMNQAVYTLFNPDEYTKISNILYLALYDRSNRIIFNNQIPRVGLKLFYPERYTFCINIHVKHFNFRLFPDRHYLGRMSHLL